MFSLLFSTTAFAKNEHAKKSLVSLGDSIPLGYNLGQNNHAPSKLAFPYLIGDKANARIRNLSVPGQTSEEMLVALENPDYREAIKKSDYITLTIGGDDLLKPLLYAMAEAQKVSQGDVLNYQAYLNEKLAKINEDTMTPIVQCLGGNLTFIITEIGSLNPTAPIVLYNIYNPFALTQHPQLLLLAGGVLSKVNTLITNNPYIMQNVYIANAYGTINAPLDIIPGDIHPTETGQVKLAKIGLDALGF